MDWQTQRGITQLVIGVCCLLFAASMFVRTWRQDRISWPIPWRLLVSFWILGIGGAYLAHSYYWLRDQQESLGAPLFVYPLWALMGLTVWTLYRWFCDDPMDGHDA
jgi:hypothetical protein